jgi:predicted lipoprotein with Yx(FWY)xxD motif
LVFAIIAGTDSSVYGYFYVTTAEDTSGICFITEVKGSQKFAVYVMFHIPLLLCCTVGCIGMIYTYQRLRNGIPSTVVPRIQALSGNIINILIYIVFTSALISPLISAFLGKTDDSVAFCLTLYLMGAEGISALIVLILARTRVDLSASLRQDILTFATRGIRGCAEPTIASDENKYLYIEADVEPDLGQLNFFLLWQFIVGNEQELSRFVDLQLMYRTSRETMLEPITVNDKPVLGEEHEDDNRYRLSSLLVHKPSVGSGGRSGTNVCTFIEYMPACFRRIRAAASISTDDYIAQFRKTAKERITKGGASGAFFFFSNDDKFVAKSCSQSEFNMLLKYPPEFADYYESLEGKYSFIGRVLGAYSLALYGTDIHFFVMSNLLCAKDDEGVPFTFEERYDLKGSTVGRGVVHPDDGDRCTCTGCKVKFTYVAKSRRANQLFKIAGDDEYLLKCRCTVSGRHEPNLLCKDNDLKYKLKLYPESAKAAVDQLERDSNFLCRLGVMDYSLLLGVHHATYIRQSNRDISPLNSGIAPSVSNICHQELIARKFEAVGATGPEFYQFGIIDFLQTWNASKMLERFFKVRILGKSAYGLSAIEPDQYKQRFVNHLKSVFGIDEEPEDPEIQRINSAF